MYKAYMQQLEFKQTIKQLEKNKGGYFYIEIVADTVEQFEHLSMPSKN